MRGCITALVTPFKDQVVDYEAFKKVLDFQVEQGINGVIVNGTTAEAPNLSLEEKRACLEFVVDYVGDKMSIGVGVSSNSTSKMLEEISNIEGVEVDYLLISTPYYNKTTQRGLIAHFEMAMAHTKLPIMLYNIPGRTGMQFDIETIETLSKYEQIFALKEASGDIYYAQELFELQLDNFEIYSGNDDLAYVYYTLGASGVVSACGNIYGHVFNKMEELLCSGDITSARNLHNKVLKLSNALFSEVNPILIKGLLADLGYISEEIRMPLIPATKEVRDEVLKLYNEVIVCE